MYARRIETGIRPQDAPVCRAKLTRQFLRLHGERLLSVAAVHQRRKLGELGQREVRATQYHHVELVAVE